MRSLQAAAEARSGATRRRDVDRARRRLLQRRCRRARGTRRAALPERSRRVSRHARGERAHAGSRAIRRRSPSWPPARRGGAARRCGKPPADQRRAAQRCCAVPQRRGQYSHQTERARPQFNRARISGRGLSRVSRPAPTTTWPPHARSHRPHAGFDAARGHRRRRAPPHRRGHLPRGARVARRATASCRGGSARRCATGGSTPPRASRSSALLRAARAPCCRKWRGGWSAEWTSSVLASDRAKTARDRRRGRAPRHHRRAPARAGAVQRAALRAKSITAALSDEQILGGVGSFLS